MNEFRVNAYKKFEEMDNPNFGPKIELNFDIINYNKKMSDGIKNDWNKV